MAQEVLWLNKYLIGVDKIDEQHKHLFFIANKVLELKEDNSKKEIRELLVEFSSYMDTHFKDEEEYMKSIGFPELEYHKKLHQNIVDTLADIIKHVKSIPELKHKMKGVAKKVLVEHIVDADMKIKYYQNDIKDENLQDITNGDY